MPYHGISREWDWGQSHLEHGNGSSKEQRKALEKADNEPRKPGKQKEISEISVTDIEKREFPGSSQESQMPQH